MQSIPIELTYSQDYKVILILALNINSLGISNSCIATLWRTRQIIVQIQMQWTNITTDLPNTIDQLIIMIYNRPQMNEDSTQAIAQTNIATNYDSLGTGTMCGSIRQVCLLTETSNKYQMIDKTLRFNSLSDYYISTIQFAGIWNITNK